VIRARDAVVRSRAAPAPATTDKESHLVNSNITRRRVAGVAAMTAFMLAVAVPASAHITIPDGGAVAGGGHGTVITLRVPHGCDGAPTDTIELQIPEGVTSVKPRWTAGWTIESETAPVPESSIAPGASPDAEQSEPQVALIRWSGGSLPDSQYADFQFQAVFPETPGTIYVPVVQRCGDVEEAWIEISAEGQSEDDLALPAPTVTVVAPDPSPVAS